ncbi:hypothetical protein QJQ45_010026 [Haematococcus lacustris]|nr:hypothetical protein QJQ45_010026 [Haematococcus lacustris]
MAAAAAGKKALEEVAVTLINFLSRCGPRNQALLHYLIQKVDNMQDSVNRVESSTGGTLLHGGAVRFPKDTQGMVYQLPTLLPYTGDVYQPHELEQCRLAALAQGLSIFQLPQLAIDMAAVVAACILITRVYNFMVFSSVNANSKTHYGTGQRVQVVLAKSDKNSSGDLDTTLQLLTDDYNTAVYSALKEEKKKEVDEAKKVLAKYLTLLQPVLRQLLDRPLNALASIITDPTWQRRLNRRGKMVTTLAEQLAQAQAPHTDFLPVGPGMDDGLVFLLALQDFPLVAYMGSHKLSELAAAHCWRTDDGQKQVVELEDMDALTLTLPHQLGTEVLVKAGQLVLFRGNTVHAGNVGVAGSCCARLYGFGRPDTVADNTTMNTSELGDLYHGLFQPIQGEDIGPKIADWNRRGMAGQTLWCQDPVVRDQNPVVPGPCGEVPGPCGEEPGPCGPCRRVQQDPVGVRQDPVVRCQDPVVRCQDPVVRTLWCQDPVVWCQDPVCQDPVDPVVRSQDPVGQDPVGVQQDPVVGCQDPVVPEPCAQLDALLAEYSDVFTPLTGLPPDRRVGHTIPLEPGNRPPANPMYRLSKPEHDELKQQIQDLLAKDVLTDICAAADNDICTDVDYYIRALTVQMLSIASAQMSTFTFAAWLCRSPVLFVQKKSGELRMCIDYRQLNKITLRDQYPQCKVFSSLDLQAGYHQIRITPEDVPKTAFRTPEGHFQFKVLCFGLTNALATFQRVMNDASATVLGKCALVYLDDILVMSSRKLSPAEINYTTGEQEFLSLVTACKEWRCYLEGVPFTLFTDHQPLVALPTQKVLSRRQARWMEFMSRFSYSLVHIAGTVNPADPLSRIVHDSPESVSVCAVTTRRQAKLSLEGGGAREAGLRAAAPAAIVAKSPLALSQFAEDTTCVEAMLDPIGSETPVTQIETAQYPAAPAAPMGLSDQLTLGYRQDPAFTAEVDHSGMYQDTDGLWRISGYRWEHVSMDLVTKLPTGTHGYDAICVIVDRLSKMVHFVPCKEAMNAMAFTRLFINNVFRLHGLPAEARYKRHADTGLKDVEFEVGAQVLLSTRNLRIKTGKVRKFVPRYVGPFVVEAKINANAYRLTLPANMSRLHPVFHVSLLKKYSGSDVGIMPPPVEWMDETPVYYVERLLDHRYVRAGKAGEFLVQWEGYDASFNTWEPRANLTGCDKLLAEYNAIHWLK